MKILLVGANGIIGSFLYKNLKNNYKLLGLCNSKNEFNFKVLDLTKKKKVHNFVESIEEYHIMIFLVGLAHKKGTRKDLQEFYEINYKTLVNLTSELEQANKMPSKIIFASTISVYGESLYQNLYNESTRPNPTNPYAVTKLASEKYLQEHYREKSWILRFSPVYSSEFKLNIARRSILRSLAYRVGDGNSKISLCNIKNIYEIINGIIDDAVPPSVYNISDSYTYSYNMLIDLSNKTWVIPIPKTFIQLMYYIGLFFKSNFLIENSIKLISDNIYSSEKISNYINLPFDLNDMRNIDAK